LVETGDNIELDTSDTRKTAAIAATNLDVDKMTRAAAIPHSTTASPTRQIHKARNGITEGQAKRKQKSGGLQNGQVHSDMHAIKPAISRIDANDLVNTHKHKASHDIASYDATQPSTELIRLSLPLWEVRMMTGERRWNLYEERWIYEMWGGWLIGGRRRGRMTVWIRAEGGR